jgi:hypothetical protein
MPNRLKGLHTVPKTLANGEVKRYFYAWKGGPRILAEPDTPEFRDQFHKAHADLRRPDPRTLFSLVSEWRGSAQFAALSPASRTNYLRYARMIENEYGSMPVAALESPKVRGEFKRWRDTMAASPRKADYAWSTLARILSHAKDNGRIPINPCEGGGRLYQGGRFDKLWEASDIERFEAVASDELRLAMHLAL